MGLPILEEHPASVPLKADGTPDVGPVSVKPGDILRVKNKDDVTYEFHWNSIPHRVPKGGDGMLPFEAVANWFGDPRSGQGIVSNRDHMGLVGFIPDRPTEVRRLRMKYGNEGGDERFFQTKPDVEVYDVDGNRILTVLDDPQGQHTQTIARPPATHEDLAAQVANLQAQIERLSGDRDVQPGDQAEEDEGAKDASGSDIPTDDG